MADFQSLTPDPDIAVLADVIHAIDAAEAAVAALQRINISNTRTNKKVNEIEDEFNAKLEKKFEEILAYNSRSGGFVTFQELKSRFGPGVKGMIHDAVEQVYRAGAEYAGRVAKRDDVFLSKSNIDSIGRLTDEVDAGFWRQVSGQIKRQDAGTFQNNTGFELDPGRALSPEAAAGLIFSALAFPTLAIATMEKYQELQALQAEELAVNPGDPLSLIATPADKIVFWSKEDGKVCLELPQHRGPGCAIIHGTEWDIGDPSVVIPIQDTHPNCRCRLLLKAGDTIFSG